MDYSKYQDLKIRLLEPGILEIVMGDEASGKLSTAGHRMHAELAEIWRDAHLRVAVHVAPDLGGR